MDAADKAKLRTTSRSAIITISNLTGLSLVRTSFDLKNGTWFKFAPERIEANSSVSFASHSTGLLRGTEGSVAYKFYETQPPLVFTWEVPYFGTAKFEGTASGDVCVEKTEKLGNLAEVHFSVTDPEGILALQAPLRDCGAILPVTIHDEGWKTTMKKANNSLLITINNTTQFRLTLLQQDIQRGYWKNFPPEEIPSGDKVQFGAESQSIAGSVGSLSYLLETTDSDEQTIQHTLPFSWSFSIIGKPQFKHKIWSLNVDPSTESSHHFEVELCLSSEESFIFDTHFTKILHPTFSDHVLEDNPESDTENKQPSFFNEDCEEWAEMQPSDGQAYPAQLELLD